MRSPSRSWRAAVAVGCLALLAVAALGGAATARAAVAHAVPVLRVCADPNNLPFTDRARRGFEDRILEVVAKELGARLEYTWWAQRRGFLRNTLKARRCDLVAGVPGGGEGVLATAPYYRSSYVFVTRREAKVKPRSLDDPALRDLKIGVQLVGDDYASSPPGFALARRGIVDNVRGYLVYGDYREESPPAEIVRAVARGDVDVALVWGPLAGYWARRQPVALEVAPIAAQEEDASLPMAFDVAMGVRKRDARLRERVDAALARRRGDVDRILAEYGVPRVAPAIGESARRDDDDDDGPRGAHGGGA